MSSGIHQYVVTLTYPDKGLSELLQLSSALVSGGFTTTLKDKEGHPHELGSNSFGIITALSPEEIKLQAEAAGKLILDVEPDVTVVSWEAFRKQQQV